jgi:hypothetical protein
MGRGIEDATNADSRVDQEAPGIRDGIAEFSLQCAVDDDNGLGKIAEKVAYARSHRLRDVVAVSYGHGADGRAVDAVIKGIYTAVEAFVGIPGISFFPVRRAGAGRQGQQDEGQCRIAERAGGNSLICG